MTTAQFPLPMSMFSPKVGEACSTALDESLSRLGPDQAKLLPGEATRFALANGIFIAASLGISSRQDLVKAAMDHLAQVASWSMPLLEPVKGENETVARTPERYRRRAEGARAAISDVTCPDCRSVLTAISSDYDRLARAAEFVQTHLKAAPGSRASGR